MMKRKPDRDGDGKLLRCIGTCFFAVVVIWCGGCSGEAGNLTPITTTAEFESQVLGADLPVVLEFYKRGCPACFFLAPTLDSMVEEYEGRFLFARIENKYSAKLRGRYNVFAYPTVILFSEGKERHRWVDEQSKPAYKQVLDLIYLEK